MKRSRSLSPKGFSRESEWLKKLKIAEKQIEHLEKTLQIKVNAIKPYKPRPTCLNPALLHLVENSSLIELRAFH